MERREGKRGGGRRKGGGVGKKGRQKTCNNLDSA